MLILIKKINMIYQIKKRLFQYHFTTLIVSYIYMFLDRILFKSKSKIYKNNGFWLHKTKFGLIPYFHPLFMSKIRIYENNDYFFKFYKLKKKDVVLEFGSGIGNETLYISKKIGNQGKVFAFEPNNQIFNLLNATQKINNLKNVITLQAGLYKKNSKIGFDSNNIENWISGKLNSVNKKNLIQTYSLDCIVKKFKLKKINFCKMNIEGAERYIVNSSNQFFKICQNIVISCHDFMGFKTYDLVKNFLKKKNYYIYNIKKNNIIWKNYYIFAKKN